MRPPSLERKAVNDFALPPLFPLPYFCGNPRLCRVTATHFFAMRPLRRRFQARSVGSRRSSPRPARAPEGWCDVNPSTSPAAGAPPSADAPEMDWTSVLIAAPVADLANDPTAFDTDKFENDARRDHLREIASNISAVLGRGGSLEAAVELFKIGAAEPSAVDIAPPDDTGVSLVEIANTPPPERALLLGTPEMPYLRPGQSLIEVAGSGTGKSTLAVQQDVSWSLGRDCLGIPAARPLRIVTVQAENDPGDLHRIASGVLRALCLTPSELELVAANTRSFWITDRTGYDALASMDAILRRHKPDILRIDPLLAFIGGDATKPEVIASFCRRGLNTLAKRHGCAIVVMHHPPKTNRLKREDVDAWTPYDWQYFGAGGADLANWTRAEIVLWAEGDGLFRMVAAKRDLGWRDADGNPTFVRYIRHGRGEIIWREATPEEYGAAEARRTGHRGPGRTGDPHADARQIAAVLLAAGASPLSVARTVARQRLGRSRGDRAYSVLSERPETFNLTVAHASKNGACFIGETEAVVAACQGYDCTPATLKSGKPVKPPRGTP